MAEEQRFDRVEKQLDKLGDKIDELTKVVTVMARIEERMVMLFNRVESYEVKHEDFNSRLGELEKSTTKRSVVDHVLEKGFWLIAGAALAFAIKIFGE